jgi:hypothetical protein
MEILQLLINKITNKISKKKWRNTILIDICKFYYFSVYCQRKFSVKTGIFGMSWKVAELIVNFGQIFRWNWPESPERIWQQCTKCVYSVTFSSNSQKTSIQSGLVFAFINYYIAKIVHLNCWPSNQNFTLVSIACLLLWQVHLCNKDQFNNTVRLIRKFSFSLFAKKAYKKLQK